MEQPRNEDSGWVGKGNISVPAYLRKINMQKDFHLMIIPMYKMILTRLR